MHLDWNARFHNITFVVGLIALFIAVLGVDVQTLTSWDLLYAELINFVSNPFLVGTFLMALLGYVIDPSSKGLSDSKSVDITKR